jgi:sec-independent protein translocase protein TatC
MSTEGPSNHRHQAEADANSALEQEAVRPEDAMSFLDHLEDLRGVLVRSAIVFALSGGLIMAFLPMVADILHWPLNFALGSQQEQFMREGLVTTSPMAVFAVILQVGFLGGFCLTLPFFLYFLARFIAPGLNENELKVLRPGCVAAFGLFLLGASFSFFVLVPAALKASLYFNSLFEYQILWSADRYYGMLLWMTLGIGLTFEFPLIVVLLVYVGILTTEQLRRFRPYSVIVFLSVAAVITPTTDPFTFLLLAVPMSLLYEVAIFVSSRLKRRSEAG